MRVLLLVGLVCVLGCRGAVPTLTSDGCAGQLGEGAWATCLIDGYPDRAYDVLVPAGDGPFPVVFAIHGGGGNRAGATTGTCPDGDVANPACLHHQAQGRGYVYVAPDGTPSKLAARSRSWNGGGGTGDWRCTGGRACDEDVDELAFFEALLDDLEARVAIDRDRLYVTGLSNGGTMSHRLACQLAGVRAVFPVGGTMQWTTGEVCEPPAPVAVAHAHGTEDPCWPYATGPTDCPIGQKDKLMKGVDETMAEWAQILGCSGDPASVRLDGVDDGTTTTRYDWPGCTADLRLYRIDGGGHTWPNGYPYLSESIVGRTPRDWGNEVILDWFDVH